MRANTWKSLFEYIHEPGENVYFYILDRSAKGKDRDPASGHTRNDG